MKILARILLNGLGLWLVAQLLPGVHYSGGLAYLVLAGFVLGLLNVLVKPLLVLLSIPAIVITLGLFYLVVDGLVLWFAAGLLAKLAIDGFGWAIAGGFVLAVYNLVIRAIVGED